MKTVYVITGVFYEETGRGACEVLLVTTNPDLVEPERTRAREMKVFDNVVFEEFSLVE